MLCEAFEVAPSEDAVEKTPEPLICSYPGSAVEMPNEVFDDGEFRFGLANLLSCPSAVDSDLILPPPADPQYINALLNGVCRTADVPPVTKRTALLTNVLHGVDRTDVSRIMKRVSDHVGRSWGIHCEVKDVWRRSSLWLLIRVAFQMTVNRSLGHASYKHFMLFFMCTLAVDESKASLSNDLLHLMSSKILRRLSKLGSSTPDWLSEMVLKTRTCLQEILDARLEQLSARPSPFRNPTQDELTRDTQLSLLDSREYICKALSNPGPQLCGTPFHPSHRRRGTIEDFLSSNGTFFDEAYAADPGVALYDVERSVEEGIDDWFACVANVDDACAQLEMLMDKYMIEAFEPLDTSPEDMSIRSLTGIELYVAMDKLVVKEIPMLADYPPEIPIAFLEKLLLRKTTSLHRLSCAYQYLSARHSQSHPGWSLLSNEFTEDSFPVRYYDQSPHLQQLKARIEENAVKKIAGPVSLRLEGASLSCTHDECQKYRQHLPERRLAGFAQSPLPASLLHAKVVVFELQCPGCIRIWRAAAPRILRCQWFYHEPRALDGKEAYNILAHVHALQPYLVERQGPPLLVQIHLAYFYPEGFQSRNRPILRYVVETRTTNRVLRILRLQEHQQRPIFSILRPGSCYTLQDTSRHCWFDHPIRGILHTPNEVLAAQADCPADFSLDEFIAFAHLRSGGSLQWLNILQGLRSRTLNLRRHQVHYLLTHAAFQVGPLDLKTGAWIWHEDLRDPFFCNVLLDELDTLVVDVGARSIDGVLMNTVSLLLTRVLASSPSEGVSDRATALLRCVRRKTFSWVQELSYDLAQAPTNEERRNLLLDMATTCRGTFYVDPATLHTVFWSAEDVDALLSCSFFIHALRPECTSNLRIPSTLHTYVASIQLVRDQ
jgi:hypothetical protein